MKEEKVWKRKRKRKKGMRGVRSGGEGCKSDGLG
jgi:hypothetical protein